MKKVFSSIWFRCVSVLLCISIIAGGGLALLNDVLYVSPEERTARSIKKIYGTVVEYDSLLDADIDGAEVIYSDEMGEITKVFRIGEESSNSYDMLFKSTGNNGYKGGTITLWVKVVFEGTTYKIDKVVLESFTKQTLMSKLDGSFYSGFLIDVTDAYKNGELFSATDSSSENYNPISGATFSANSAVNAVNLVLKCINDKGWEK